MLGPRENDMCLLSCPIAMLSMNTFRHNTYQGENQIPINHRGYECHAQDSPRALPGHRTYSTTVGGTPSATMNINITCRPSRRCHRYPSRHHHHLRSLAKELWWIRRQSGPPYRSPSLASKPLASHRDKQINPALRSGDTRKHLPAPHKLGFCVATSALRQQHDTPSNKCNTFFVLW